MQLSIFLIMCICILAISASDNLDYEIYSEPDPECPTYDFFKGTRCHPCALYFCPKPTTRPNFICKKYICKVAEINTTTTTPPPEIATTTTTTTTTTTAAKMNDSTPFER